METIVEKTRTTVMTQDDLKEIHHLASVAALDRWIVRQASTPMLADAHAASNLVYAGYFTLPTEGPQPPADDQALRQEMHARG